MRPQAFENHFCGCSDRCVILRIVGTDAAGVFRQSLDFG